MNRRERRAGWLARWEVLERHGAARQRLAAVLEQRAVPVDARAPAPPPARKAPCDVIVVHDEVNDRHGTGVLLLAVFGEGRGVVTVRSHGNFGGEQAFGARAIHLPHWQATRPDAYAGALEAFADLQARRILCVPYYEADALTASALHDAFDAPLCTWLMDDLNVAERKISDPAMRGLLERSRLRLAIGPELRAAYQAKYRLPLHLAPPLVAAGDVLTAPTAVPPPGGPGLLVGNVWGKRWLQDLRHAVREAGLQLDWTTPSSYVFERPEREALAADGIRLVGKLEGPEYLARLRAAPFVVVPTGTLGPEDDRAAVTRYSVPSRMTYTLASSHTPILVIGSAESAAARLVERLGVGRVVPYAPAALRAAAEALARPDVQAEIRARAARLAPAFSAAGMADWIWRSLEAGRPADDRFERLHGKGAERREREP